MTTEETSHGSITHQPDVASTAEAPSPGTMIAQLLVDCNITTSDQLRYAQRIQSKLPSARTLLSVLQELHFVTSEQVSEVLRTHQLSIPLGALLVELGYLKETDLKMALALQRERPDSKIGDIILENHFIGEEELVEALTMQLKYEQFFPATATLDPDLMRLAAPKWFRANEMVIVGQRDGATIVAMADPLNRKQVEAAKRLFGEKITIGIARRSEIREAIDRFEAGKNKAPATLLSENLIVQTVNQMVNDAVELNASDIHIEPMKDRLRIRFRQDGVLINYKELPTDIILPLASRIKILAKADIAEKRRHQDGRIFFDYKGTPLDIRVSTYITINGETIVLRLLNVRSQLLDIKEIGMAPRILQRFTEDALDSPSGVVIVTGPTGSGKTTTLYSSINYLNNPQTSIITAEDPVEYVIDGISQCSINPKINVTYEETLKHVVRQDPDVIVIGEIRDLFSAETAIQAALTGHKVITTFHTEDSIGGLLRLLNMNIEAFLISSTVVSVVAQRLVRRVCPHCAQDQQLTPHQIRRLGYEPKDLMGLSFKAVRGCSRCHFMGYNGRIAIFELLVLNEHVKDALIARKTSYEIRRIGTESTGLVTLLEDSIHKALQGMTTFDEIIRQVPRLNKPRPINEVRRLLGDV